MSVHFVVFKCVVGRVNDVSRFVGVTVIAQFDIIEHRKLKNDYKMAFCLISDIQTN